MFMNSRATGTMLAIPQNLSQKEQFNLKQIMNEHLKEEAEARDNRTEQEVRDQKRI